jgi:hypothetical protein
MCRSTWIGARAAGGGAASGFPGAGTPCATSRIQALEERVAALEARLPPLLPPE